MTDIKYSIIVPTYNSRQYIETLFSSLREVQNSEIIIIDDGSEDRTLQIVNDLSRKLLNGISVKIFSIKHSGPSAARNIGIQNASGERILFVDSDDTVDGQELNRLSLRQMDSDIISFSNTNRRELINSTTGKYSLVTFIIQRSGVPEFLAGPVDKLYRTKFLKSKDVSFNESVYKGEDLLFNVEAILKANAIELTGPSFYHINYTDNSLTRGIDRTRLNNSKQFIQAGLHVLSTLPASNHPDPDNLRGLLVRTSIKNDLQYAIHHGYKCAELEAYKQWLVSEIPARLRKNIRYDNLLQAFELKLIFNNHHWILDKYIALLKHAYILKRKVE